MGVMSSIRNFFYAVTHANQLVTENSNLKIATNELSGKLLRAELSQHETREMLNITERKKDTLVAALKILSPKDIPFETLRELYNAVQNSFTPLDYRKAGIQILGDSWFAACPYLRDDPIWKTIETEVYRAALISANVLPQDPLDRSSINHLRNRVLKAIDAKFDCEQLSSHMPIGRIEFLHPYESIIYRDAGEFISDITSYNDCGSPMSITVYSDPETGKHIDTSWLLDLDPPPKGFQIVPYQDLQQEENYQAIQNAPPPASESEWDLEI